MDLPPFFGEKIPVKTDLFFTDIIISFKREIENPICGKFRERGYISAVGPAAHRSLAEKDDVILLCKTCYLYDIQTAEELEALPVK